MMKAYTKLKKLAKMKHRYLIFQIEHFYPAGGMGDYVRKTLSLKTAVEFVVGKIKENPHSLTDYQIYDIVKDEIVYEFIQNAEKYKIVYNRKERKNEKKLFKR